MGTIPRLIHRIWFGNHPVPAAYEAWWQAWQRQLPSYQFVTWTDQHIPLLPAVSEKILAADSFAKKADIARYEILRQHGGTYLDCDMQPLHAIDFADYPTDLLVIEPEFKPGHILCQNDVFSVRPNHPILTQAVAILNAKDINAEPVVMGTGPGFFGPLVASTEYLSLPDASFNPYHYAEPFSMVFSRNLNETYGIHRWGNSWVTPDFIAQILNRMVIGGDLSEIERLLPRCPGGDQEKDSVIQCVTNIRAARRAIVEASQSVLLQELLTRENNIYFEFWKLCYYLFALRPAPDSGEPIVWHIGAAHPQLSGRLRPILVNFDPPTIFLETDGALLEKLLHRYQNNRNIRLIHGSLYLSATDSTEQADGTYQCRFEQLCLLWQNRGPDILVVSSSQEAETVGYLLQRGLLPAVILLSADSLDEPRLAQLQDSVLRPYRVFVFDGYIAAYRRDIFFDYCKLLFVEYGNATIFRGAATLLAPR